ncbi:MAG: glycosyltransferase, partial [Lewinella sp.]|nr:glycosyltransferase [Lewinella sp.]
KRLSPALPDWPFRVVRLRCWFEKGKLFYLEYNLRLLFFLLGHRADLLNAVDLDTLLPGYLASRWKQIPLVYDAHEYFTETPEVVRRPRVQRIWEWLADTILPRLQHAYTVGPGLARLMGARYGLPFSVIRNLPYRSELPANRPSPEKIIFYQGVLNEGRGLETAIRAMEQLPGHQLWLAGEGDLSQSLRELVEMEALHDRVQFLGFIQPADLPALTRRAWLGLNLLENRGLSYYYSLANKAFDYLQAGVPAIHMAFPEYQALQQEFDCCLLLPDLEVDNLVTTIQALAADEQRYAHLQQQCRQAAAILNWESEKKKLLAFYRPLLQLD